MCMGVILAGFCFCVRVFGGFVGGYFSGVYVGGCGGLVLGESVFYVEEGS